MPIYEYKCQKCGAEQEVIQKVSDPPIKKCGQNGCKGKMRRLISNTSFVLKGSGWYVTDYPSEARQKGMESESKSLSPKKDKEKKSSGAKSSAKSNNSTTKSKSTKSSVASTA